MKDHNLRSFRTELQISDPNQILIYYICKDNQSGYSQHCYLYILHF